jgi:hypothetical protein
VLVLELVLKHLSEQGEKQTTCGHLRTQEDEEKGRRGKLERSVYIQVSL